MRKRGEGVENFRGAIALGGLGDYFFSMNQTAMDRLFWTAFGVGEAGLLYLLLAVVNSGYSWADVGGLGVLVLLAGMGAAAGVFLTARTERERRWCLKRWWDCWRWRWG